MSQPNHAEFARLIAPHLDALFRAAYRLTGNRPDAEDLVQDVFVRILKYRRTFQEDGSFETWVFRVARNARSDHFRTRRAVQPLGDDDIQATAPGPGQQFERGQQQQRERALLKRALMQLADDKRELLVLARYRSMNYQRIAGVLGIEVGAVKVRVHRAMKELRDIFFRLTDEDKTCSAKKSGTNLRII
jgi:RNA polymerase sigma-70 factor (ECF subfamily)